MKTNVTESSLSAYDGLSPNELTRVQRKVIAAIQALGGGWVSRKQIAQMAGLETSTVAGRVNELVTARRLERDEDLSACPVTGRGVHKVRIKEGEK